MIRLSRAAPRTLLPNQEVEITLVIYADQDILDVVIEENIDKGFVLTKEPEQKKIIFNKQTHPDLDFIPQGHTRSISYNVKVTYGPNDFDETLVKSIIIKGKVEGVIFSTKKKISSKIKHDTFNVMAPFIILKDIILRDDLESIVVFLENAGLVDAKSVCITFDLSLQSAFLKIEEFIMHISMKDKIGNEYKAKSIMTDRLKQALNAVDIQESEFAAMIIDLHEPEEMLNDKDIKFSHFEQKKAIEIEANGRSYPLLMPITK